MLAGEGVEPGCEMAEVSTDNSNSAEVGRNRPSWAVLRIHRCELAQACAWWPLARCALDR